jgi:hypothetical protein
MKGVVSSHHEMPRRHVRGGLGMQEEVQNILRRNSHRGKQQVLWFHVPGNRTGRWPKQMLLCWDSRQNESVLPGPLRSGGDD